MHNIPLTCTNLDNLLLIAINSYLINGKSSFIGDGLEHSLQGVYRGTHPLKSEPGFQARFNRVDYTLRNHAAEKSVTYFG